jgi:electron transfer flavoprotein alpha subunit
LNNSVWVILEFDEDSNIIEPSFELISELFSQIQKTQYKLVALSIGKEENKKKEISNILGDYGIDEIIYLSKECGGSAYQVACFISEVALKEHPLAIFAADTVWGHEMASWVAIKLGVPMFSTCVEIGFDASGRVFVYRPLYNGLIDQKVIARDNVLVATCMPEQFNVKKARWPKTPVIKEFNSSFFEQEKVRVVRKIKADPKTMDIEDADILVVGGGGMGSLDNFKLIQRVADLLGGSVAGTRVARDKGWIGINRQIGQTGKKVSPKLLISCGVSGALQHTIGLKDTKKLVAINIDKNAPIFKLADFAIVGDAPTILKDLINKLEAIKISQKDDQYHEGW